ncbi:hypothetical protein ABB37_05363 [Leptomonas pyrrhocoris]|uniref:Uncharacterized protein n=1 Tax=Leptomonas pyrrhocoris TaxID=157538 RepID=A0A0M9FZY6_LEPPY|nr:hypothetical protein ABB37_05363 [Leptomonas pyrrhocoris]KPA79545.1 hypothetical protein ABB37_05363 [Leptomonas pyrrhocoris]|eukprot:XP_015657984.1 hypothetical protein ABB37_05363 [Leptomonas pyrrhocoris]
MYSPEVDWLLGTESEQRREGMKSAILRGEEHFASSPVSKPGARARARGALTGDRTAVFFDDNTSRLTSAVQGADGGTAAVLVLNGLPRRGPHEPAEVFSSMPARYL